MLSMSKDFQESEDHIRRKPGSNYLRPGILLSEDNSGKHTYQLRDYSAGGIGIISPEKFEPGTKLILVSCPETSEGKWHIVFFVVWGSPCNDDSGNFHYGLRVTGGSTVLTEILDFNDDLIFSR